MKKHISSFLKFLIVDFGISVTLIVLLAFLDYKLYLSEKVILGGVVAIYILANFLAGFLAGKTKGEKKFLWGIGLGAAYFCVLFLVSSLAVPGTAKQEMGDAFTLFLCATSGMLGGMLS